MPHPLTNFEIQRYYQSIFQEIICLKKKRMGAYVINLDEYADVSIHWIGLFFRKSEIVYFDSFSVEHVPEEIKRIYWMCGDVTNS